MKAILLIAFVAAAQAVSLGRQVAVSDDFSLPREFPLDKPDKECMLLLSKVMIDAEKLAVAISTQNIPVAIQTTIQLATDIRKTIMCFKKKVDVTDLASLFIQTADEDCKITHMKNAVDAIRTAIQNIKLKLYKEAAQMAMKALEELALAQTCKD